MYRPFCVFSSSSSFTQSPSRSVPVLFLGNTLHVDPTAVNYLSILDLLVRKRVGYGMPFQSVSLFTTELTLAKQAIDRVHGLPFGLYHIRIKLLAASITFASTQSPLGLNRYMGSFCRSSPRPRPEFSGFPLHQE